MEWLQVVAVLIALLCVTGAPSPKADENEREVEAEVEVEVEVGENGRSDNRETNRNCSGQSGADDDERTKKNRTTRMGLAFNPCPYEGSFPVDASCGGGARRVRRMPPPSACPDGTYCYQTYCCTNPSNQ